MENEIIQVAIQKGLVNWEALSTIGVFAAVLAAVLLPIIRDCMREKKNANAIRNEACFYLDSLKRKLDQVNISGGVEKTGKFEKDNKKDFDALEFICRSVTSLKPKEQTEFRKFLIFYKTCEEIKQGEVGLVQLYLFEITKLIELFRKSMNGTNY